MVSHSRLYVSSAVICRDEQYDFFFDPPVEFSGDFTISITAQLGQDSSWDEWKVEMRDFVGRSWVSVGDLSEDLSDGKLPFR